MITIANKSVGQIKNELMAVSPYVSDIALLAYLDKPLVGKGSVPPGHVKEVIIANSPVNKSVKAATDARNLPVGIQMQIDSAQIGTSPRRELELEIAYFENQLSLDFNSLSRFFLHDSLTVDGIDSVIEILKSQEGINRELQLAEAFIETERLVEAKVQLNTLEQRGGFDNFCKLQNIVIDIIEDSASFDTLLTDTLLKLTMDSIANDTLEQGYLQARAILALVFGGRFQERILDVPPQVQSKIAGYNSELIKESTASANEETADMINIYPNPANNTVTIDIKFPNNLIGAELTVYNLFGTKVYKQIIVRQSGGVNHDVSGLPEGVYLYTITENQYLLLKKKILVIR